MKKMRRLIPAIAMLLVSAVMLSTASFAWFTIGNYATTTGMSVTAEASSSLLIINGDVAFENGIGTEYTNTTDLQNALQTATNSIDFDRAGQNLQPATALTDKMTGVTTTNGLVTLEDATLVDQNKGTTLNGATYKAATEGTNYIEYTAYIAAAGVAMNTPNSTLKATVSLNGSIQYINKAVTIAFWVADTSTGTVNFEGSTNLLAVEDGDVTIDLGTTAIPVAVTTTTSGEGDAATTTTTLDYVKVYIRVYYDGALVDESLTGTNEGKTYVRNDQIGASGAAFDIRFDYTPNTTNS